MDAVERQPLSVDPGIAPPLASTVRQGGDRGVRGQARPAHAGSGTPRHVRDVLADFLQCDPQHDATG